MATDAGILKDALQAALNQNVQRERERHPSVLGVHFVPKMLFYKTLLSQHGYDVSLHYDWGTGTGRTESYIDPAASEDHEGGFTAFLQYPEGLKAVIFIHNKEWLGKPYVDLLCLFHEMGHVDDVERGVNLKKPVTLSALLKSEVYAHHYVAKRCIELGYHVCLRLHDASLYDFAKTCDIYAKSVEVFRAESAAYRPTLLDKSKIKDLVAQGVL